ncbi:MAG: hypothetical protein Terrestrivirus1_148 [Terrestrivirus sp.]|uniref:Uncharacterized protein n=1 Tax=Terrestrivirus sp. TaxID=2487775 RepID=A0A3G4ZLI7_9VIRU|nr:MAG: hypothetical protein Terrestrivirus1_148 [Terrestrivirus sp.]
MNSDKIITIFGSCRQHSIKNHFTVMNIQECLGYPHYSKETIQEIKLLKNLLNYNDLPHCFRTDLLNRKSLSITPEQLSGLRDEFINTDVFIIEIASRISYEYEGKYTPYAVIDPQYNIPFRNDIKICYQSDQEIENDIIEIIKLLAPKPVIIISHICSYSHGKRYELAKLLENICLRHHIVFYNPSVLTESHKYSDLYVPESVLAHYTDYGHNIVSLEYKKLIDNVLNSTSNFM